MDREIEFRVWDSYDKKMFSWDEITSTSEFEKNIPDYLLNVDRYKCMLKLGIFDKNGKEIYSGDVISYEAYNGSQYTFVGVVEYNIDGYALKCIKGNKEDMLGCYFAFSVFDDKTFKLKKGEIIGNAYENEEIVGG